MTIDKNHPRFWSPEKRRAAFLGIQPPVLKPLFGKVGLQRLKDALGKGTNTVTANYEGKTIEIPNTALTEIPAEFVRSDKISEDLE